MKILIIEDYPVSLRLASEVLQGGGHVVMLATSADQAIYSISAVKPDAILLDLRLPGIAGEAVARQCRHDAVTRDIPIIAATAYPQERRKHEAELAGCDAFIVKPIDTRTLLQQIAEIVAAKAASTLRAAEGRPA
jgi:two-component system, cell cycle response regulator